MQKTILFFMIMALICFFACRNATAQTEVSIYCDDNYPPYSYAENGHARGIYPAILEKAFSRMTDYNITILPIPWKRGLHYIKTGEAFALCPPYYRPELRPYMWPYSTPILREEVVLICRDDIVRDTPRTHWPEDFYGLTIGSNAGFVLGGKAFDEAVRRGDITLDEAINNRVNLIKLGIRRTDCYLNDRLSIAWELNHLKNEGQYDEGGKHAVLREALAISAEWGYLGFTRMDFGRFYFKDDFIKKFNSVIRSMRANGEIQSIVNQVMTSPQ